MQRLLAGTEMLPESFAQVESFDGAYKTPEERPPALDRRSHALGTPDEMIETAT